MDILFTTLSDYVTVFEQLANLYPDGHPENEEYRQYADRLMMEVYASVDPELGNGKGPM